LNFFGNWSLIFKKERPFLLGSKIEGL